MKFNFSGKDEVSKKVTDFINNEAVSSRLESEKFVAIKIQSDQDEYMQFAKICKNYWWTFVGDTSDDEIFLFTDQLVPVPSIFFIKNGIPIKVVAGAVKTVEELVEAIETVTKNESTSPQQQQSSSTENQSSSSVPASSDDKTETVCEDGVCYKKTKDPETSQTSPSKEKNETEDEKQEKIKKAMKLIEQKRIERIQEEQRLEKEKEIQRRKEGQEIINLKKWQEDKEMKQIKEDQLREKNEAKAARQRVLDQIEQDKKERAQRFAVQTAPTETKPSAAPVTPPTTISSDSARIQFKKPNGDSEVVTFDSSMLFADLHLFVKNDILQGAVKDFSLATAFPRREFSQVDFDKSLQDLSLTPSATLLIIFGKKVSSGPSSVLPTQTDGSYFAMISALFFGLMTPVVALFAYLKNFVMRGNQGGAAEPTNEAGKRKRNEEVLTPNDA